MLTDALTDALARAVEAANRQVRALAHSLGQATGTTLTAVAISGQRAALAHLGATAAPTCCAATSWFSSPRTTPSSPVSSP